MSAADAFPYPPDDPVWLREIGGLVAGLSTGLGEAVAKVRATREALATRWKTPAGVLAVAEVDAIVRLGVAAGTALVDTEGSFTRYATVVESARTTIDGLRRRYADADLALHAVTTNVPQASVVDDARATRDDEHALLRRDYDDLMADVAKAARRAREALMGIAGRVSPMPESRDPRVARAGALELLPFMSPHVGTTVRRLDGMVLVDTGDGDDDVQVRRDPATGAITLVVNGEPIPLTSDEASHLVIRTNGGYDTIEVGAGITFGITLLTGAGSGRVRAAGGDDVVLSGAGNDVVDAGGGDDRVAAGAGSDVVYAGEGDDTVDGGAGADYIDGFHGDDHLAGGDGADVLSGGAGADVIDGDAGDDVVYAGAGRDVVTDDEGHSTVHQQGEDQVLVGEGSTIVTVVVATIPAGIRIEGDPAFVARVQADLETMASSPTGQAMLRALGENPGETGGGLRIVETDEAQGYYSSSDNSVLYNPDFAPADWGPRLPPVVVLQHEMVHAYNHNSGTLVSDAGASSIYVGPDAAEGPARAFDVNQDGVLTRDEIDRDHDGDVDTADLDLDGNGIKSNDGWLLNSERQAVGLPVDHDADPGTPDVPADTLVDHPDELTENALRAEMGLPPREHYEAPDPIW